MLNDPDSFVKEHDPIKHKGEHKVFVATSKSVRCTECNKKITTLAAVSKCTSCREIKAHPLEIRTRAQEDHNTFLRALGEETLCNLERLNTRHNEISKHDKANTARLAFDTLVEDIHYRREGAHSPKYFGIRFRFRAWINQQLDGSFRMPLALYFADARIVLGVQLGEHTRQQLDNCFQSLGL